VIAVQQNHLTDDMRAILTHAQQEAGKRHAAYVDVEHLTLGLLKHENGAAYAILKSSGADTHALYEEIASQVGIERGDPIAIKGLTRATQDALSRAAQVATDLHHQALDGGHLLLSLIDEPPGTSIMLSPPLDPAAIRESLKNTDPMRSSQPSAPPVGRASSGKRTPASEQTEFVLVPTRAGKRNRPQAVSRVDNRLWILAGILMLFAYMAFVLPGNLLFTFVFVLVGWVFSVTLHEFAHALVAYMGGDYTVKEKGYLSFNPLKYTHPLLSVVMPLMFLMMGGIGLPGGAVYIERHRLRSKWWGAAVSAAGPTANLLLALILSAPFALDLVDLRRLTYTNPDTIWQNAELWSAVAFLAALQVTAVALNLLPIPPLDGFGVIEPLLDERTRFQLMQFTSFGFLLILVILWTPLGDGFWDMVRDITSTMQIPGFLISEGYWNFMFWREP
jgi:Zn-dependent protease